MENKIIFTNNPIENDEIDDYIGIKPYVDVIKDSLDDAKIIALTGEFGSGKSSIINSLDKGDKTLKFKKITLLHYINKEKDDLSSLGLIKIMLQSFTDDSPELKSFVNKKMSNYGELSFAKLNELKLEIIWLVLIISFLIYLCSNLYDVNSQNYTFNYNEIKTYFLTALYVVSQLEFFIPYLFIIAIGYTLAESQIVFSLWDSQGKKEINEEEIIDLFYIVLKKEFKCNSSVKNIIIVIEDADRLENYDIVSGFLKILFRLSQLEVTENKFTFIVPIKEEFLICDEDAKRIFPKIFDLIINIKKIYRLDYKKVIIKLLNSKKETEEFKRIFKEEIKDFPYLIGKILDGKELNLRTIKNRLNSVFQLHRNIYYLDNKINIDLDACANIAYLENEFSYLFHCFLENEKLNSKVFEKKIAKIDIKESDFDDLKSCINKIQDVDAKKKIELEFSDFVKEMTIIINSDIFVNNLRMYFFRYPKETYLLSQEEITLIKALSLDDVKSDLNSIIKYCNSDQEKYEQIVEHLKLLKSFEKLPINIIFKYNLLLSMSLRINYDEYSEIIIKFLMTNESETDYISARVNNIFGLNDKLSSDFVKDLIKYFASNLDITIKRQYFISFRSLVREVFYHENELVNLLFSEDKPIVTREELEIYYKENEDIILKTLCVNRIDNNAAEYIIEFLSSHHVRYNDKLLEIVNSIIKRNLSVSSLIYLRFLTEYSLFNIELQKKISIDINNEVLVEALNAYTNLALKNNVVIDISILMYLAKINLDIQMSENLFEKFYQNNLIEKTLELVPLVAKKKGFNLINGEIVNKTLSYFLKSNYNIEIFLNFRSYIIKYYDKDINKYKELFSSRFPMLLKVDIENIRSLKTINELIRFEYFDIKLYETLIRRINSLNGIKDDYAEFIFKFHNSKNVLSNSILELILTKIDFNRFKFRELDVNVKSIFLDLIYSHYKVVTSLDKFVLMKRYKIFDVREIKIFENKIISSEISDIIESFIIYDVINNEEIVILNNLYFDNILNSKTETILHNIDNINYFSSKLLKDEYEISKISDVDLIKLFRNTIKTREKLLGKLEFVLILCKMGLLSELTQNEIFNIAELTQNIELIENIFRILTDDKVLNIYLSEVKSIDKNDETLIVDFLVKERNIVRLNKSTILKFKQVLTQWQKGKLQKHFNKHEK